MKYVNTFVLSGLMIVASSAQGSAGNAGGSAQGVTPGAQQTANAGARAAAASAVAPKVQVFSSMADFEAAFSKQSVRFVNADLAACTYTRVGSETVLTPLGVAAPAAGKKYSLAELNAESMAAWAQYNAAASQDASSQNASAGAADGAAANVQAQKLARAAKGKTDKKKE